MIKIDIMNNNKNIIIDYNSNIETQGVYRVRARLTTPREGIIQRGDKRRAENIARHSEVSEKAIERYLVGQAKRNGLLCLKYSNPNMVGYPDRLLVLPGGGVAWVELKSKGRKPTKIQQMRMAELNGMGHLVRVIDNKNDIDELIALVKP